MKKLISITIAVVLIASCFVFAAHASTLKYSVRIEGIEKNLYWSNWELSDEGDDPIDVTVADVLESVSKDESNDITITGAKDGFITAVNGVKNGSLDKYDGWMYSVNGKVPEVGVNDYKVNDGDEIVLYYGDFPCQIPVLDTSLINEGKIKVQSWDGVYSQNDKGEWVASYDWAPVAGATLKINGEPFKTDENGIADLSGYSFDGKYYVQIEKKSEKGAPQVCRFKSDYQIDIHYKSTATQPATEQTTDVQIDTTPTKEIVKTIVPDIEDQSLYVGQVYALSVEVENSVGKTSFISNRKSIASVSSSGRITAKKKGTAVITIKNNKVSTSFKVTVKNPKLNRKTISLKKKHTFKIKITGKNGKQTYKSSKKSVAKVSKNGKVTAKKKGKATITVTTNGSVKLKLKVTVK